MADNDDHLTNEDRENEKLTRLRTLAKEGFDQLDRGQAIQIEGVRELASYIARIGRRAAASPKRRSRGT